MQSLMILGRQPALGIAELESLYGSDKVRPVGSQAALLNVDPCLVAFDRLGGSVKFCKVLTTLETIDWQTIQEFLVKVSPEHSRAMPEGKMQLGLSVYDLNVNLRRLQATGLTLKKALRTTGRSVRLVPNNEPELNSAQVIHNHLTGATGWELVLVQDGTQTIIAQTVKVQDIAAYTQRDRGRPKRDARIGMLPPKLAQIIINLAVGALPEDKLASICEIPAGQPVPAQHFNQTVLDPFCGTGVILQEALLMGYEAYGSDNEQRMYDFTAANLEWLQKLYQGQLSPYGLAKGDATSLHWETSPSSDQATKRAPLPLDFVASETYLGRPFTTMPNPKVLDQTVADCNLIITKFLRNIHAQVKPGTRLCLAIPAWQTRHDHFRHLPLIDQISKLGYNRVSFVYVRDEDLMYYREDQIVARELMVIIRK